MTSSNAAPPTIVGVLALQGAFAEHILLLRQAAEATGNTEEWAFTEVRTVDDLERCGALIIPGGESTAISLVAARSGLLEPLRDFVKVQRKPVWGTCAGLILLSESANRTKKGGQELIGGLDVRVNRNHFGRQTESFEADIPLDFLGQPDAPPFHTVFIRAPVVEKILPHRDAEQVEEAEKDDTVVAPSKQPGTRAPQNVLGQGVQILARLPPTAGSLSANGLVARDVGEDGDIVAVKQGNVFGTAFHPELTQDHRIHAWWLQEVRKRLEEQA